MPWFYCDDCGDSIKKPKVVAHFSRCSASSFTCIDCCTTFDRETVHGHTSCVTEKDKYVHGATKPGGFAANGFVSNAAQATNDREIVGIEYLSTKPPWNCEACQRPYISKVALFAHTSGQRHRRKVQRLLEERAAKSTQTAIDNGQNSTTSVVVSEAKPSKKKKLQRRLALEIVKDMRKRMSLQRFKRRFEKRCKEHGISKELRLSITELMKKTTDIEVNESYISMRQ